MYSLESRDIVNTLTDIITQYNWNHWTKVLKVFWQYDNDLMEKPVICFQLALEFTAWFAFYEDTNYIISKILNQGRWMIRSEVS